VLYTQKFNLKMSKKRGRTTKMLDDVDVGGNQSPPSKKRKKKYERKTTKAYVEEVKDLSESKLDMFKNTLQKTLVKNLREELVKRGLSKQGKKAELIERLAEAMVEEEEEKKKQQQIEIAKRKKEKEEKEAAAAEAAAQEAERKKLEEEAAEKQRAEEETSTKEDTTTTTTTTMTSEEEPSTKRRKKSRWGGTMMTDEPTTTTVPTTETVIRTTATTTTTTSTTTTSPPKNDSENHDVNFWSALLQSASSSHSLAEAEPKYERVVKKYPSTSMFWRVYADHCMREGAFDRLASIFRRALPVCRQVELYVLYVQFVKTRPLEGSEEMDEEERRTKRRETIEKAYEFSLKRVGQSLHAYPLWNSFFDFLEAEDNFSIGAMNEQYIRSSRVIKTRRWYQVAVGSPFRGVEKMWNRYTQFEKDAGGNAVSNLEKLEPKHKTARNVLQKREGMWSNIRQDAIPQLPDGMFRIYDFLFSVCVYIFFLSYFFFSLFTHTHNQTYTGTSKEKQQIRNWIDLINYEKRNPLHRSPTEHRDDVRLVYYQCLSVMRYHVKLWHDFVSYEQSVCVSESEGHRIAADIYRQACNSNPQSVILGLALAEIEELRKVSEGDENADPEKVFERLWQDAPCALVFVEHQRVARRLSGVKASRRVFRRARKHERCTWQVFVSAARLEYHSNNERDAARNILELGMKRYSNVVDYVLAYADLLSCLNDNNNLRALFERTIPTLMEQDDQDSAMRVWDRYVRFEAQEARNGGNIKTVARVMRRWREEMPDVAGLNTLRASTYRYRFQGLVPEEYQVDKFFMTHSPSLSFERS